MLTGVRHQPYPSRSGSVSPLIQCNERAYRDIKNSHVRNHAYHISSCIGEHQQTDDTEQFLHSYPEVVNYLVENFVDDQAAVKVDSTILCYIQQSKMTSML